MAIENTHMRVTEAQNHATDRTRFGAKSDFQRRLAEHRARLESREQVAGATGTARAAENAALGLLTSR